jgi:outer membrane protein assembly factor BamB
MQIEKRIGRLAVLAASLFVVAVAGGAGDLPDWAQWRGPNRDGVAPCTAWESKGRDAPLWTRNVGLGYSNVCLRDGRLITHGFDVATEEDIIVCLDALTGKEHWRYRYPSRLGGEMHTGGTLTTPVARGDRVFVLSRLGKLYCFDLVTGAVVWKRALDEDHEIDTGAFGLPTTPVLTEDAIVLNVGPTLLVDQKTGATRWATKDYGYSYSVPVVAEIGGRRTFVIFNAAGLVTLDPETGSERSVFSWTSRYNVNCAAPIVIGDKVFISTGYDDKGCAMVDLSGAAPTVVWKSMLMSNKMTGCVLFEGHLYGFDDSILRCLDLDGERKWQERDLGLGALLVSADGRLVVLSEDGELVIADATPEAFRERSRTRVFERGKCWTTPVLSGGLIYCRNSEGDLVCLDHRPERMGTDGAGL